MALRTDYKDDILDLTQNTRRKYRIITNDDGTFSFEDVTAYSQVGDSFGALELNEIANAVKNASGGIRYIHGDVDEIQIRDDNGDWHFYDYGGLNYKYLYKDGVFNTDLLSGIKLTADTSQQSLSFTDTHIEYVANVTSVWHEFGWVSEEAIDVTDFNKLKFEYSISATKKIEDYNVRIGLSTTNANTYSSAYSVETVLLAIGETSANGIATLDCSALSGIFYLTSDFRMSVSDGLTITLNISKIWLEK